MIHNWIKKIVRTLGSIFESLILFLLIIVGVFIGFTMIYGTGYKKGQIDAIDGNWKYERIYMVRIECPKSRKDTLIPEKWLSIPSDTIINHWNITGYEIQHRRIK